MGLVRFTVAIKKKLGKKYNDRRTRVCAYNNVLHIEEARKICKKNQQQHKQTATDEKKKPHVIM